MELEHLCLSEELIEGLPARAFDLVYEGRPVRGFLLRHGAQAQAYVNRCTHVAMEMDWQPGHFLDHTGQWLLCASHGATYAPDTGACVAGPCRGGLIKVPLVERDGGVYWRVEPPLGRLAY